VRFLIFHFLRGDDDCRISQKSWWTDCLEESLSSQLLELASSGRINSTSQDRNRLDLPQLGISRLHSKSVISTKKVGRSANMTRSTRSSNSQQVFAAVGDRPRIVPLRLQHCGPLASDLSNGSARKSGSVLILQLGNEEPVLSHNSIPHSWVC
jgi:hypothetical protein